MKVTRKLRSDIRKAVIEATDIKAYRLAVEIGLRDAISCAGHDWKPNSLLWGPDTDLGDMCELADFDEINDDPENPGCHMLDIYAYQREGVRGDVWKELITNVYMFLRDGAIVGATMHEEKIEPLRVSLGFPRTRGW